MATEVIPHPPTLSPDHIAPLSVLNANNQEPNLMHDISLSPPACLEAESAGSRAQLAIVEPELREPSNQATVEFQPDSEEAEASSHLNLDIPDSQIISDDTHSMDSEFDSTASEAGAEINEDEAGISDDNQLSSSEVQSNQRFCLSFKRKFPLISSVVSSISGCLCCLFSGIRSLSARELFASVVCLMLIAASATLCIIVGQYVLAAFVTFLFVSMWVFCLAFRKMMQARRLFLAQHQIDGVYSSDNFHLLVNDFEALSRLDEHNVPLYGLSRAEISRMAAVSITEQTPNSVRSQSCSICLEKFQVSEQMRILPCLHKYHTQCVDPWLLKRTTCPICKVDVLSV